VEDASRVPRRRFLANLVLGASGALGIGALGARLLAFLSPPAPPERVVEYALGPLEVVPDGGGVVRDLPSGRVAISRRGDRVQAFSAVCTHLGCIIQWQPTADHAWFCPCHQGRYDRDGRVVGGPPPRPLVPVVSEVRDGQIVVRMVLRLPVDQV